MVIEKVDLQSVEQFNDLYGDDPYVDSRVQQLSGGKLGYHAVTGSFNKLHFELAQVGAGIRRQEVSSSDQLLIGFPFQASQVSKLCAEELDYGDVYVIRPGVEVDHVNAQDTRGLWFALPPESAQQMCIAPSRGLVKRVSKRHLGKLAASCHKAVCCPGDWQARILADLYSVLEPWRTVTTSGRNLTTARRHYGLFRLAEDLLPPATSGETVDASKIAELLGVSRRTIFHAFQSSIGMPPAAYQRLRQLHAMRQLLLVTTPGSRTITELAISSGFSHLGRMYVDYHKLFGETPRATLRQ